MTRPRARLVIAAAVVGFAAATSLGWPPLGLGWALVMSLTWVSSVALGRSFFRGRAAMSARRYDEAIEHFERFVAAASTKRLRALRLLWVGLHTSDPVALALNNLELNAGRLQAAVEPLERAVARDPQYAVPHTNLCVAYGLLGDAERAEVHARAAVRSGFSHSRLDTLVRSALAKHAVEVGRRV